MCAAAPRRLDSLAQDQGAGGGLTTGGDDSAERGGGRGRGASSGGAERADGYASCVWRLVGAFRSQAGWLELREGRLRYWTPDGVVFDARLEAITGLAFPWYYSGGGLKLRVGGEEYRLSFVEPNGAQRPDPQRLALAGETRPLALAAARAQQTGAGRGVGREWRRLLEGRTGT